MAQHRQTTAQPVTVPSQPEFLPSYCCRVNATDLCWPRYIQTTFENIYVRFVL